jgi:hypothetical protein
MMCKQVAGSPVALSTAVLLSLGRIGVGMAGFGKVAGEPRLTLSSAIGNAGVVTVSELVGASHCPRSEDEVMAALGWLSLEH